MIDSLLKLPHSRPSGALRDDYIAPSVHRPYVHGCRARKKSRKWCTLVNILPSHESYIQIARAPAKCLHDSTSLSRDACQCFSRSAEHASNSEDANNCACCCPHRLRIHAASFGSDYILHSFRVALPNIPSKDAVGDPSFTIFARYTASEATRALTSLLIHCLLKGKGSDTLN